MTALEAALEGYFVKKVRLAGGKASKVAPVEKGMPDRLVLMPGGKIYLVELKTDTGRVSPAQALWHERAAALGTQVLVLSGIAGIDAWIRQLMSAGDPPPRRPGRKKTIAGPVEVTCNTCGRSRKLPSEFAGRTWLSELHAGHDHLMAAAS